MKTNNSHNPVLATIKRICDYNFSLDWESSKTSTGRNERAVYYKICRDITTCSYLQIGSSIDPIVDAETVSNGLKRFQDKIEGMYSTKMDQVYFSLYKVIKKNAKQQLTDHETMLEQQLAMPNHIAHIYHEIHMLKQRLNDITR